MNTDELASELANMYNHAPAGCKVAMIHLFGIKYCREIVRSRHKPIDIVLRAKMPSSYATEVSKGMHLAEFVTVREEWQ